VDERAEILAERTVLEGWLGVAMVRLRMGGQDSERALILHPSGVTLLAYDPARKVAFTVCETRLAVLHQGAATLTEPVAGVLEDGEDPLQAARREAREEIGLELGELEFVARVWMTPSSSTEQVDLFLAAYAETDKRHSGGGLVGEQEHLEIAERPLAELWDEAHRAGGIADAKLFMLLQALRLRRPELFA
jgi:nudix-type nucleoside diphosphatase (YffH/AdpP family)